MQALLHFLFAAHLFFSPQYVPAGFTKISGGTPPTIRTTPCNNGNNATNPSVTCSYPSGVVAGDILVFSGFTNSQVTINTPTGCSSSWSTVGTPANQMATFIGTATSSGSCTATMSAVGVGETLLVIGADIANAITTQDGTPVYGTIAFCTAACVGPSITTTVANDMVITFVFNGSSLPTITTPWTQDLSADPFSNLGMGHIIPTASTVSMPFTQTGGGDLWGNVVAIKP